MAANSLIEWTDATWQVTSGCARVSPGCQACYAEVMAGRLASMAEADVKAGRDPGKKRVYLEVVNAPYGPKGGWSRKVVTLPSNLDVPLKWKKGRRIFVNSMSDLFHADVPFEFVDRVFAVMAMTPRHTYQVLTKRPERMAAYFESRREGDPWAEAADEIADLIGLDDCPSVLEPKDIPLPNVWLGTSVENQKYADLRIPHLLRCPAAVRFLSCEPLLGPIVLNRGLVHRGFPSHITADGRSLIDLVITGGESGSGARPCDVRWIESLVEQCRASGVACFVKQLGARPYYSPGRDGATGYELKLNNSKGGNMAEWPEALRVRQMPAGLEASR